MTPQNPRTRQQFLVELWREPAADGSVSSWRGVVKHLAHDRERYVAKLGDVTAFIAHCIAVPEPTDDGGASSDAFRTRRPLS